MPPLAEVFAEYRPLGCVAKTITATKLTLWFAKNASAGILLRCNSFITVMHAAELRDLDNPSDA